MTKKSPAQSQIDKFREAARQLDADHDPQRFAETVKKLIRAKPDPVIKPVKPEEQAG